MIVYRITDRIPVRFGEITFWLAPLTHGQRQLVIEGTRLKGGSEHEDKIGAATRALRYSLKGLDGVQCADGTPYELSFDKNGELTDDCLSEVLQLDGSSELTILAMRWALDRIGEPATLRDEHRKKLEAAVAAGRMTKEQVEDAMRVYDLPGVTVDLSAVRTIKKKPEAAAPAP
jgi:hypothetical protein